MYENEKMIPVDTILIGGDGIKKSYGRGEFNYHIL
jgi:hypothetical protein